MTTTNANLTPDEIILDNIHAVGPTFRGLPLLRIPFVRANSARPWSVRYTD